MTKRITFTMEPKSPVIPIVPSIKLDNSGDVEISLTRGNETINLCYICSDEGYLVRYGINPTVAERFGIKLDSDNRLSVSS